VALALHLSLQYATYIPPLRGPLGGLPYFRLHSLHETEFLLIIAYAGVVLGLRAGITAVVLTGLTSTPFILTPYIFGREPRPGSDPAVLSLLETVIGPQFAGAAPGVVDLQAQMEAYVAAMLDLRDALANVGNPDGSTGVQEAIAMADKVAGFTPFFQEASPRIMASLATFYAGQMQAVNAEVAESTKRIANTIIGGGIEELIATIERGPAFALASTATSPLRQVEDAEGQTDGSIGIPMPIMPGETTNDSTLVPTPNLPWHR
jgi:hypothetical protein